MLDGIRWQPWRILYFADRAFFQRTAVYLPRKVVEFATMPSLIRLLMVLGLLGGAAYGAMFALANFVEPKQREMSITIPQQRLTKPN
jgi:hypothetical protein